MNNLTDLLTDFQNACQSWQVILIPYAQAFFLTLAAVELTWTGIRYQLASSQSAVHLPELLIRKLTYLSFCFFFIRFSPAIFPTIIGGFQKAGGYAVGITSLAPSAFLRTGAFAAQNLTTHLDSLGYLIDPFARNVAMLTIFATIAAFALIAAAMTLVLIESYIAIGVMVFLIPFAATRWTHALAEGAMAFVFRAGVKLFTMYLLAGTILNVATTWALRLGDSADFADLIIWAMTLLTIVILVWSLPSKLAHAVVPPTVRFGLTPVVGDN